MAASFIIYEPHPVSLERKAELRSQGFKIVDAKFKPLGDEVAVGADADGIQAKEETEAAPQTPPPVKRRGRKPKVQA